jgi:recombination protein RecA
VANKTEVAILKNKTAPPFQVAEVIIRFGIGVSRLDELFDLGIKYKEIIQSGSFFKMGNPSEPKPTDEKQLSSWWIQMGQGRDKVLEWLRDNPKMADVIEKNIRDGLFL